MIADKIDVLRRHCDDLGRDIDEIEITALFGFGGSPTPSVDEVVSGAEELAALGVSTIVTGSTTDDPAGWLESTFGPAMGRIAAIEPITL